MLETIFFGLLSAVLLYTTIRFNRRSPEDIVSRLRVVAAPSRRWRVLTLAMRDPDVHEVAVRALRRSG